MVGNFQGRTGTIHAGDLGAVRGEMKGESPLIAENVERFPFGVAGRSGVVLALIEKGAGLLAFQGVELEADAVHGERCRALLSVEQRGRARGQALQFANAGVSSLHHGGGMQVFAQRGHNGLPHGIGIHTLGENLQRENVVVAIHDESRKKIGFAENEAVGVGVADQRLPVGNCVGNALAEQGREVRHRLRRDQADRNLRGAGV